MHDVMMYCVYLHAEPHRLCCEHIYASSSRNVQGSSCCNSRNSSHIFKLYLCVCNIYVCVIKLLKHNYTVCWSTRRSPLYRAPATAQTHTTSTGIKVAQHHNMAMPFLIPFSPIPMTIFPFLYHSRRIIYKHPHSLS